MVSNRTLHYTPTPLPATHCLNILYFDTGKRGEGGRVEPERRLDGGGFGGFAGRGGYR
jgi:hypothetical protein